MRLPPLNILGRRFLLALTPLLLVLEIPGALELWRRPYTGMSLQHMTVVSVDPRGSANAAGVLPGDILVALDGHRTPNFPTHQARLFYARPGETVDLEIRRGDRALHVPMQLVAKPPGLRLVDYLTSLIGLCFLFLGFATYLRRPDALGRRFSVICVVFAFLLLDLPTFPSPWVMQLQQSLHDIAALMLPAFFLRFFLIFPEGISEDNPAKGRQRWLMLPPLLLAPFHLSLYFTGVEMATSPAAQIVGVATALLFAIYFLGAIIVFARKIRRADRWVLWSKLRLALLGVTLGIVPFSLATVARQIWPGAPAPLEEATILLLPLVPASFSMALLRTGSIDLGYLARQALISLALSLPLVLGTILFLWLVGPLLQGSGRAIGYALGIVAIIGVGLGAAPLRRRVGGAVDHIFYPEQLEMRLKAGKLATALNQPRSPQELAEFLGNQVNELFRPRGIAVYVVDDARFVRAHHHGEAPEPPLQLSPEASLIEAALQSSELLLVEPMLTGPRPVRLDQESQRLLATTDAAVLCPLTGGGRALGMMVMGPPTHGEMYREMALYHLRLVASQAGGAFDNAVLHQEDLQRERLTIEMNLAREIQSHLLPAEDLVHGDFELSGSMVSSRKVGGDVFDHFLLADGRIVLAVADASGKGVPASLLMSSMRTAVRDTVAPGMDAANAVGRINQHVHGMTSEAHFIALFLGLLNPENGVLQYCVAGIEPPLWLRAREGRVERLHRGGPVLGVDPGAGYREGLIRLRPGDALIAYTDGMVDEEDAEEQPFGPERLVEHFQRLGAQEARTIRDRMISAVTDFGTGESTDDKTLLVLKFRDSMMAGTESART